MNQGWMGTSGVQAGHIHPSWKTCIQPIQHLGSVYNVSTVLQYFELHNACRRCQAVVASIISLAMLLGRP